VSGAQLKLVNMQNPSKPKIQGGVQEKQKLRLSEFGRFYHSAAGPHAVMPHSEDPQALAGTHAVSYSMLKCSSLFTWLSKSCGGYCNMVFHNVNETTVHNVLNY